MRKFTRSLATVACSLALCGLLTGCKVVKDVTTRENPVKTVYVYSPDGKLLDKGTPDQMFSNGYNTKIEITMNGKRYTTSWGNVIMVEE